VGKGGGESDQPSGASWVVEVGVAKLDLRPVRRWSEGHVRTLMKGDERFRSRKGNEVQNNPQPMLGISVYRDSLTGPFLYLYILFSLYLYDEIRVGLYWGLSNVVDFYIKMVTIRFSSL
jgi:hypothetical protein